jgi:hypothetical protein
MQSDLIDFRFSWSWKLSTSWVMTCLDVTIKNSPALANLLVDILTKWLHENVKLLDHSDKNSAAAGKRYPAFRIVGLSSCSCGMPVTPVSSPNALGLQHRRGLKWCFQPQPYIAHTFSTREI